MHQIKVVCVYQMAEFYMDPCPFTWTLASNLKIRVDKSILCGARLCVVFYFTESCDC